MQTGGGNRQPDSLSQETHHSKQSFFQCRNLSRVTRSRWKKQVNRMHKSSSIYSVAVIFYQPPPPTPLPLHVLHRQFEVTLLQPRKRGAVFCPKRCKWHTMLKWVLSYWFSICLSNVGTDCKKVSFSHSGSPGSQAAVTESGQNADG